MSNYDAFLKSKLMRPVDAGFEPLSLVVPAFDWQAKVIAWAVRKGRCALFEDCGLGKTLQQLEWASQVARQTKGVVMILAPLAVAEQTVEEGRKFGVEVKLCMQPEEVPAQGVCITNYDRLELFEEVVPRLAGIVLDESSILKAFNGKTRGEITRVFARTPYKLACTATPSPNDLMELGNHAEFLGVMTAPQMLATWFINDTANTGDWRLKKHAKNDFWRWVASWAACVSHPRDLGYDCAGYDLPPLTMETIEVDAGDLPVKEGELIAVAGALSATDVKGEKRRTLQQRCEKAVEIAMGCEGPVIIWCDLNDEADLLLDLLPPEQTVEVRGCDKREHKRTKLAMFTHGERRIMVTKPDIAGFGLNWQHCADVIYVGVTYSFEDIYQTVRRCWRFGQKRPVHVRCICTAADVAVFKAISRKMAQHEDMHREMQRYAGEFLNQKQDLKMKTTLDFDCDDKWKMWHGDCVRAAAEIADESVGMAVFSPPFADLFTYSDDAQDMGNCANVEEFMQHFGFLVDEIERVMMPGREVCVHCCDLLATKWKDGAIELKDFSGMIVQAFRARGFLFHSRITIWKSPVTEMQRTKAHGLLYKTLQKDSAASRVGAPDYLLVFRKRGENPRPITHSPSDFPLDLWQEVASPVWMTVDQGNVLNGQGAREQGDERHICPLQLDVINRALMMWSNAGDLVYSPFAGIGSEGFCAVKAGRRFVGSELKKSYFDQACTNLRSVTMQGDLFETVSREMSAVRLAA
jgi:DNA modification methylase